MDSSDVDSQWRAFHLTKMFQAAAAALFLYDYVLNFNREIVLVWRQEFTRKTALFLMFRSLHHGTRTIQRASNEPHILVITSISSPRCNNYIPFHVWMTAFSLWTMQGLLQFRCHALNNHHKGRIIFLTSFFALEVSAMIVISILVPGTRGNNGIVAGPMCSFAGNRYFYGFTIPVLSFECLLIALTFSGGLRHFTEMRSVISDWTPGSMMLITTRDALIHFVVTCTGYSIAGAIWLHNPLLFEIPLSVVLAVNVVIGSRVFLNLRQLTSRYNPEDLPEMVPNVHASHLLFASQENGDAIEMASLPHFYAIPDFLVLVITRNGLGVVVPYQARVRYYTSINKPM
ncbi:hypothetical protein BDN67DRAFT_293714 [Paxillus ammoniavirescens]|nr:hypothetical protein BDN67DRAFT_293714 [Paxillus ammoniavirescens]